ncbi:orotidine-5'-phosphate decarboxylase [Candidatus Woesearchaeota archaeon]|nr:orotidine-5'-phosphate decarboxylase [Candidatus Woesearchaeota archaeon]
MQMNFVKKLIKSAEEKNSIVCLGMDPVLEEIPINEQSPSKKIVKFYSDIIEATHDSIGAVKPNYAFFAQYGFPGLRALKKVISVCKNKKLPVILDAKRGDIGKSSAAYAKEVFEFWKADAVTISPFMGKDSVEPFIKYCGKGKGVYILTRTSNPGAADLQDYQKTAAKVKEWHTEGVGAVVGATNVAELKEINEIFDGKMPLLIPGVGAQGGSAKEIVEALGENIKLHRINSSSGINYVYKKQDTDDYAGAAAKAVKELNGEIGI